MISCSNHPDDTAITPCQYAEAVAETDVLNPAELTPILQGLYGEVGGVMSTAKKHLREGKADPWVRRAAIEEFGDVLWYLAALCRRRNIDLDTLLRNVADLTDLDVRAQMHSVTNSENIDTAVFELGRSAAQLLADQPAQTDISRFAKTYLATLEASGLSFSEIARANLDKVQSAFLMPPFDKLPEFDASLIPEERLPNFFKIRVDQRANGKSYLSWRGIFIGEPLSDNIGDPDGYRFHDVFHLAHAAVLHWSPVTRALIKHKRKSQTVLDEAEDGGRAIVVEEGLSAWIFSRAKDLNFFEGQSRVSLEILKTVHQFVHGFEVEACPLRLWEKAILDGYAVFRQIRNNQGGWILGSRKRRTITYKPLDFQT